MQLKNIFPFKRMLIVLLFGLLLAACGAPDDELTLIVGPEIVGCSGEGLRHCMEVKYSADSEWELFPAQIEGFDYAQGYEYEIRVKVTELETPTENGMTETFELIEIVRQEESY